MPSATPEKSRIEVSAGMAQPARFCPPPDDARQLASTVERAIVVVPNPAGQEMVAVTALRLLSIVAMVSWRVNISLISALPESAHWFVELVRPRVPSARLA